jgi:lysophospholipase L1-like esterase
MPDYQSPSGAAAFCVAPGRASDLAPGRAPDAVAAQGTSGSVSMCDHQYVALGDSYSAGDGAVLPNKKGQDYPDSCHRTRQAYPPLAARAIGMTLKDEACSGATTEDVLSKQLGPLAPDTKLVSITIGGNDAELFGYNGLVGCLLSPTAKLIKQSPSDWFASCEHRLRGKIASGLRTLKSKLVSVYRAIEQRAPHARLLVLEYPNPFPPAVEIHVKGHRVRIGDVICPASYDGFVELLGARLPADLFAHIWASDIPYLHDVVESLDAHVRDAAQAAGATALPMDSAPSDFRSHTVCDVGRQWFYGIRFPPYPTPSSLHPNIPGNLAMARAVEAAAPR